MRQWRLKNKEKIKEYITKYKQENREHVLAVQRVLNHKNYVKHPRNPKINVPGPKPKVLENIGFKIEQGLFKISF